MKAAGDRTKASEGGMSPPTRARRKLAVGTGDDGAAERGKLAAGTGDDGAAEREKLAAGTGDGVDAEARTRGDLAAGTGRRTGMTGMTGMLGMPAALATLPDEALSRVELAELAELATQLGHRFARPALLRAALTTPSWVNEHPGAGWPGNACLEFLGDAVLGLVTADALWQRFPELAEGDLTRLRASLVSEASLGAAARSKALGERLLLGRGDVKSGVLERDGALADAVEAVLAAAYLDARASGTDPLAAATSVFMALLGSRLAAMRPEDGVDPKSRLQAVVQAQHRRTPVYAAVGERPKGVDGLWRVQVTLTLPDGEVRVLAEAEGVSLRAAEYAAAVAALAELER